MSDADLRALERASIHDPLAAARLEVERDRRDPLRVVQREVDRLVARLPKALRSCRCGYCSDALLSAARPGVERVVALAIRSPEDGQPYGIAWRAFSRAHTFVALAVESERTLAVGLAHVRHWPDEHPSFSVSSAWPSLCTLVAPNPPPEDEQRYRLRWRRKVARAWWRRQLNPKRRARSVVVLDSGLAHAWAERIFAAPCADFLGREPVVVRGLGSSENRLPLLAPDGAPPLARLEVEECALRVEVHVDGAAASSR